MFQTKMSICRTWFLLNVLFTSVVQAEEILPLSRTGEHPFLFTTEAEITSEAAGMVMVCPAHAHGTPEEALAKLRKILENRPKEEISAIWVCRSNQLETLKMFAPEVDRVVINTFCLTSKQGPDPNDLIWPRWDHPLINHLRQSRKFAGEVELIACIDLSGESSFFAKRSAALEEIIWMVYAVVGANFQGIAWRGSISGMDKIKELEVNLAKHTRDLGAARPVGWAKGPDNLRFSTIASSKYLFVVLLHPDFMKVSGKDQKIILPLEMKPCQGSIILQPPPSIKIRTGKYLSGIPLQLTSDEDHIQVPFVFRGGGEILIFPLE